MSSNSTQASGGTPPTPFRCPVCRASQPIQETCRRCEADLRLVAQAYRRRDYLRQEREKLRSAGNGKDVEAIARELRWLGGDD